MTMAVWLYLSCAGLMIRTMSPRLKDREAHARHGSSIPCGAGLGAPPRGCGNATLLIDGRANWRFDSSGQIFIGLIAG